jgi:chromatin remodeling complex protein RSC6
MSNSINHDLGVLHEEFDCPNGLIKMKQKIVALRDTTTMYRKMLTNTYNEIKSLETLLDKYLSRIAKQQTETKKTKRPSGFAAPVRISEELSQFIGRPKDELVSRTEATKYVNLYIKEHRLMSADDKTIIVPDERLHQLLGTTETDTVRYFTLQKYLNRHFLKKET